MVRGRKMPKSKSTEKVLRIEHHCKGQRSDWGKKPLGVSAVACALFQMKLKLFAIKKEPRTCSDTGEGGDVLLAKSYKVL